jgi:hypothetical protein
MCIRGSEVSSIADTPHGCAIVNQAVWIVCRILVSSKVVISIK